MRPLAYVAVAALVVLQAGASMHSRQADREWPEVSSTARPWTRWWWHGSAVDRATLTTELEAIKAAGLGGVEITPIYGVRGGEGRFIAYLSDDWMQMLAHVVDEGQRMGIGVDMATGTGWPFGGPWVGDDHAPRRLVFKTWTVEAGQAVSEPISLQQAPLVRAIGNQIYEVTERQPGEPPPTGSTQQPLTRREVRPIRIEDLAEPVTANKNLQALALEQVIFPRALPLVAVVAYGSGGRVVDLTAHVGDDRHLTWKAPDGTWVVYALFAGWHGKLVERAAPGGEGNVIDHFSTAAIRAYLARFDRAFSGPIVKPGLRAFFNDSYEVDDASGQGDWTPRVLEEFRQRRGYDLLRHLPALIGPDPTSARLRQGFGGQVDARVRADFRETISDLLLDSFTREWSDWARTRGAVVRNQAHGSPANILDLYAASDIPETEGTEIARFMWATSAAHVAGRQFVSAEAATWLGEHFRSTLADVRAAVDHFFVSGVNHIVYHGTAYSPPSEPWPGWQFYATVDFSRRNAWWRDFAALNQYVTRVQSFLQRGRPDHDVLLYFPFYDAIAVPGEALLTHFGGANRPTAAEGFEAARGILQARGYTHDYISDRQLRAARAQEGRLVTGGGTPYRVLVIPPTRFIPLETMEQVLKLAHVGATVVVWKGWPQDLAGFRDSDTRRQTFRSLTSSVSFTPASNGVSIARHGLGQVLRGDDLDALLSQARVRRELMVDMGLMFARRVDAQGRFYFINNRGDRSIDTWVPLEVEAPAAAMFEPMHGRHGAARTRRSTSGSLEVYLQLPPGQSLIVAAAANAPTAVFPQYRADGAPIEVQGPWTINFTSGGPALPASRTIERLTSWTMFGSDAQSFSGTATYTTRLTGVPSSVAAWELDLGAVHESARVRLNGRDVGTLIGPPYRLVVEAAAFGSDNVLEVAVTNLSANRIGALDRSGAEWKKFYNVNFPARLPANRGADGLFTAVKWEPLDSGLVGPVRLTPLAVIR